MGELDIEVKSFSELDINELYALLQLRSEVFVVEQDCVYQDIDGKDQEALHVLGYKEGKLLAYTRLFRPGYYFEEAAIGRVVVSPLARGKGFGHIIMHASREAIEKWYETSKIKLSAQQYLVKFYESHGYKCTGDPYLEDGIPHIAMIKD